MTRSHAAGWILVAALGACGGSGDAAESGEPASGAGGGGQGASSGAGAAGGAVAGGAGASGASGGSGNAGAGAGGVSGASGKAGSGGGGVAGTAGTSGQAGGAGAGGAAGKAGTSGTIDRLQIVIKTGDGAADGTDKPVKLCLNGTAAGCFDLDNTWTSAGVKHDDFGRGVREHFDLAPGQLAKADVKLVSVEAGAGDAFDFTCVSVVADGELLYCRNDLKASIGTGGVTTWKDTTLEKTCGSCYRGGSRVTHGPMVGFTDKTSARIWLRTGSSTKVQVRYGTGAALGASKLSAVVTPAQADDFTVVVPLEGLSPGERYYYTPVVDGDDILTSDFPSFSTAPQGAADFSVAFGSCSNFERINGKDVAFEDFAKAYPVYDDIAAFAPDLMLLIGDNHYGNTWSRRGHGFFYRESRDQPQLAAVLRKTPTLAIWDDHDFGTNDSDGAEHPGQRDDALAAFRDYWANPPSGAVPGKAAVPGIWHRASWGGVDFFLIDDRYYREPGGAGKPPATMLGADQLKWLVDAVTTSKAKFKLIASGSMWSSNLDGGDTWGAHAEELKMLLDTFENKKVDGVVLLSGDKHRSAVYLNRPDDGVHPPIYELMSSGLSGAEGDCVNTAQEKFCVDHQGPTYGRIRFKMTQPDPELVYEVGGPELGIKHAITLKASVLAAK